MDTGYYELVQQECQFGVFVVESEMLLAGYCELTNQQTKFKRVPRPFSAIGVLGYCVRRPQSKDAEVCAAFADPSRNMQRSPLVITAISLLIVAAADAGGLRSAFLVILCNFHSSDRNNMVIRAAAPADSGVDSVEMPLTASGLKISIAQETDARRRGGEMCNIVKPYYDNQVLWTVSKPTQESANKRHDCDFTLGRPTQSAEYVRETLDLRNAPVWWFCFALQRTHARGSRQSHIPRRKPCL